MQEQITYLDDANLKVGTVKNVGRKPVKLSTFQIFRPKTEAIRNKLKMEIQSSNMHNLDVPEEPIQTYENTLPEKVVERTLRESIEEKIQDGQIVLPSKEVLESRKQILNVEFYKNSGTDKEIKFKGTRKLRINILVAAILEHARSVAKEISMVSAEEVREETPNVSFFDNLQNINSFDVPEASKEPDVEVSSKPDTGTNVVNIDEYLNQETRTVQSGSNDSLFQEMAMLLEERKKNAESLATQKEILANLRKRIEENNVLCAERTQELREENMALTRELDEVLASINQETDKEAQQLAFLDEFGKGKVA